MHTGRTDSTQLCGGSDDNTYYNTRGVLPFCNRPVLIGRQRILEFFRFTSILEPDDSIRYKALGQSRAVSPHHVGHLLDNLTTPEQNISLNASHFTNHSVMLSWWRWDLKQLINVSFDHCKTESILLALHPKISLHILFTVLYTVP